MKIDVAMARKAGLPESWACIDCGVNTAPGCSNAAQWVQAACLLRGNADGNIEQTFDGNSEVYYVKPSVWKAARMTYSGGCLCIGCLEARIGRTLTPNDFPRRDPLNLLPGTERLLSRRDRPITLRGRLSLGE